MLDRFFFVAYLIWKQRHINDGLDFVARYFHNLGFSIFKIDSLELSSSPQIPKKSVINVN
jgi:hypothetical protein